MTELGNWNEVDEALGTLGRIELDIMGLETELGTRLRGLMGEYDTALKARREEKAEIEAAVGRFCGARKEEFAQRRSRRLTFGKIAFRTAERIDVPPGKEERVVAALMNLGWVECVEMKERLDRNALRRLSDTDLSRCGLKRVREDHFRIEPDLDLAGKAHRAGSVALSAVGATG